METNAGKIRDLRVSKGWSQEQLASIADTTTRTIQRLESGSGASLETLSAVASAFDREVQDLLKIPVSNPELDREREEQERQFEDHARVRALQEDTVARVVQYWNARTPGVNVTEIGCTNVEKWLADFTISEVMQAMDAAARQYLEFGPNGCLLESAQRAFEKIPGICFVNRQSRAQPEIRDLYYVRGILRNRIPGYFDNAKAIKWLLSAARMGVPIEELRLLATDIRNWTQFHVGLEELVERHQMLREENIVQPASLTRPISLPLGPSMCPAASSQNKDEHLLLSPIPEKCKSALDYFQEALSLLQLARSRGESWITIDFEEKTYTLGRCPDGFGTPYPIDNYLALDELAGAIERRFQFLESL